MLLPHQNARKNASIMYKSLSTNFKSTPPFGFSIIKRTYQIKPWTFYIMGYAKVLSFNLNGHTLKFIKFVRLETLVVSPVFVHSVLHILISMLQEKSGSFTESICARYVWNNKWGHARKISFPCIFFFNISFYMSSVM